jgi:hypothetical protein
MIIRSKEEIEKQIEFACEILTKLRNESYAVVPSNPEIITINSVKNSIQTLLWVLGYELHEITDLMKRLKYGGDIV